MVIYLLVICILVQVKLILLFLLVRVCYADKLQRGTTSVNILSTVVGENMYTVAFVFWANCDVSGCPQQQCSHTIRGDDILFRTDF